MRTYPLPLDGMSVRGRGMRAYPLTLDGVLAALLPRRARASRYYPGLQPTRRHGANDGATAAASPRPG
jgi:hypothetical protein